MRNLNPSRTARFRPVLTLAIVTPLVILLWAGLELWIAYSITPKIQKNYGGMIRETAESWQDNTRKNGWDHLAEAIRLYEEHVSQYYFEPLDEHWSTGSWEYETIYNPEVALELTRKIYGTEHADAYYEAMHSWALETIGMLDSLGIQSQLDTLANCTYVLRPIEDSIIGSQPQPFLSLGMHRSLARCLYSRMILSRDRGDWESYTQSFQSISTIGHAIALQPSLLDAMVASAILSLGRSQVVRDLQSNALPDDTIIALHEIVLSEREGLSLEQLLHIERYSLMDTFQRLFGRGGRLIPTEYAKLVPFAEEEHWIINVQGLWKPRWGQYEKLISDHFDELDRIAHLPFAEREPLRPENRPRSLVNRIIDPKDDEEPLPAFDPSKTFAERFLSEDTAFTLADQQILHDSLKDGLQLLLAIEAHRIATGDYPASLEELVPASIQTLPIDPCSTAGDPWIYRRFDAPDAEGRPFLLYAVGFDMQDHGGARPTADFSRAFQRKNAGTDYVLSHPPLPEDDE